MAEMYKNYLEHHGILGQKWGRKMGPPYPLDAGDHSATEKKEGYKKSIGGGRNEGMYDRHEKKENKQKNAVSVKAAANKALAKVYGLNEKTYSKSNKTLSSMNKAAKEDRLKKAEEAQKEANAKKAEKDAAKEAKKAQKEEYMRRLRDVDPDLAKNKESRRVAMDYHNLSNREFALKYMAGHPTVFSMARDSDRAKKKFAKNYVKSKGNTYGMGVRRAAIAAFIVANSDDVTIYGKNGPYKIKMGKAAAAKALGTDIAYSEIATRVGYDKAEQRYKEHKEFEEWKKSRSNM